MSLLKKIQKLDIKKRKLIFWIIVTVLASLLFLLWLKITILRLEKLGEQKPFEDFELPQFEIPQIEIPTFSVPTITTPTLNLPTLPTQ